uniref:Uncharacterized protein n=1 Tax=Rhizochromulina marina TaxID=1034831 RepID=A0A7S2WDP6_9STRA|mmetsp:Transcript_21702/g.63176  ORF Transcript_21702/g.63176 Transcript_21702/m.63176 type:complete len:116 (+) Transcript_21702:196-543(+)
MRCSTALWWALVCTCGGSSWAFQALGRSRLLVSRVQTRRASLPESRVPGPAVADPGQEEAPPLSAFDPMDWMHIDDSEGYARRRALDRTVRVASAAAASALLVQTAALAMTSPVS